VIALPSFSGVPHVSRIECCCRYAGEEPKSNEVGRKRWFRRIAWLLRQDDVSRADLRAVAAYLRGDFDRKQGQPRMDPARQYGLMVMEARVEAIQAHEHCSQDKAIRLAIEWPDDLAEELSRQYPGPLGVKGYVETPDNSYFSYLSNYLKR
jgi:hypothetical protein